MNKDEVQIMNASGGKEEEKGDPSTHKVEESESEKQEVEISSQKDEKCLLSQKMGKGGASSWKYTEGGDYMVDDQGGEDHESDLYVDKKEKREGEPQKRLTDVQALLFNAGIWFSAFSRKLANTIRLVSLLHKYRDK